MRHHRYETSWIERGIWGAGPVTLVMKSGAVAGFTTYVVEKDGRTMKRDYALQNYRARVIARTAAAPAAPWYTPVVRMAATTAQIEAIHAQECLDVRVLRLLKPGDGAEVGDSTAVEEGHLVGHLTHEVELVGDDHRGQAELFFEPQHQVAEVVGHDRVDHGSRLVVEDAFRLRGERPGDGHRAPVARGQIGGIGVDIIGQVNHAEQPADDLHAAVVVVFGVRLEGEQDVFADGERVEQRATLKNHGDFAPDRA